MLLVRQTMGIVKMRIRTPQRLRPIIHLLYKVLIGATHMLRNGISALIGRIQQERIEALLHGHDLVHITPDTGALRLMNCVVGKCHLLVHPAALNGQKSRQDLGNTGRIQLPMRILLI